MAGDTRRWFASVRLEDCLSGRNNNLNLLRMVAATMVLVSHAVALTTGDDMLEPFRRSTGRALGEYAVAIFFAISGLLIARSFDRRESIHHFASARFLRLWPALFVVLVLLAFALGPVVTTLPLNAYLADPATWAFVPRNLSLALRNDVLPGVFAANPFGPSTDAPLWTLFYEIVCYGGVVAAGYLGALKWGPRFWIVLALAIAGHVWSLLVSPPGGIGYRLDRLGELGLAFALGMAAYAGRTFVVLGPLPAAILWLAVIPFAGTIAFSSAITVALAYTALWLGYVPKTPLLHYNRLGDFSYGTYIYAFPVQQTLVHYGVTATPLANTLVAFPITLVFAIASWHLVEKHALALAKPAGERMASFLGREGRGVQADSVR